ncbi:hypothetical protein A2Z33_01350 [Candidatus Gottesmanbacteria bacterium RBG_16_52_11]|uniref:Uncharacterized protein n=1 Tax=Candidatus Gottesmanbacteria bacterium RBG_16_52_11 TaxID=1798374 RepID=A0A1F5YP21_9BACT|nr:MAG: hypothetical protein A2Z33_01350 [Candidatus Gottesmanbacteria bacterium RBG_16_52_11]
MEKDDISRRRAEEIAALGYPLTGKAEFTGYNLTNVEPMVGFRKYLSEKIGLDAVSWNSLAESDQKVLWSRYNEQLCQEARRAGRGSEDGI